MDSPFHSSMHRLIRFASLKGVPPCCGGPSRHVLACFVLCFPLNRQIWNGSTSLKKKINTGIIGMYFVLVFFIDIFTDLFHVCRRLTYVSHLVAQGDFVHPLTGI